MAKSYSFAFVFLLLLSFSSCQSLEQISIEYMVPAEVNFPPQLRKVAIVNNTSELPDNKLIPTQEPPKENVPISRATAYANGDPRIASQSMAEEIARQNYFDVVVICDSALRANDRIMRESTLSQEEVDELTNDLNVDFLIALENLQFKVTRSLQFLPDYQGFLGAIDIKAFPLVRIYVPGRSKPMTTLQPNDSIYWEDFGNTVKEAMSRIASDQQIQKEASEFSGTVPVKLLTPHWIKGKRNYFAGGMVNMRDAAVYVRENSWEDAFQLWLQAFNTTKSDKKKMKTAFNIALYYEVTDSIAKAEEWAMKAQKFAKKVDKVDKYQTDNIININDIPHYYLTTLYVNELKERNNKLSVLNIQMSRFNDDF